MAKESIEDVKTDRKEMFNLLRDNGLLLDLPEDTLARMIGNADLGTLIEQQISRINKANHRVAAVTGVRYIRRLGNLPEKRVQAMQRLLDAVDSFCWQNGKHNCNTDPDCPEFQSNGEKELQLMDKLMCDLIREHYGACQKAKKDWDPDELAPRFDEVRELMWTDGESFCAGNPQNINRHLDKSRGLLELVCERSKATMLAAKVTGHILPPELVEMVTDCMCDDQALRSST